MSGEGLYSPEAGAQVMEESVLGKEEQPTLLGADQVLSPALTHKPQKTGSGTVVLCPLTKLLQAVSAGPGTLIPGWWPGWGADRGRRKRLQGNKGARRDT